MFIYTDKLEAHRYSVTDISRLGEYKTIFLIEHVTDEKLTHLAHKKNL